MRKLIILMLLMIPIAYGLEECLREQLVKDIPCYLITGGSSALCTSTTTYFYSENGSLLQTGSMDNLGDSGRCNITFNLTTTGQYTINSSLDTWNVTVKQEDNMLGIIILQLFLIIFFVVVGLPHKAGFLKIMAWGLAIIEILMTVFMVYINELGQSIAPYLYWNWIIMLIIGSILGFMTINMIQAKMIVEDKSNQDTYTKWYFSKR